MRNKDFAEKKNTPTAISLSLGTDAIERLNQRAVANGLNRTAFVRNWIMEKSEYAADVEAWISMHAKKLGVPRQTVIERILLFAMKTEQRTGKEVV